MLVFAKFELFISWVIHTWCLLFDLILNLIVFPLFLLWKRLHKIGFPLKKRFQKKFFRRIAHFRWRSLKVCNASDLYLVDWVPSVQKKSRAKDYFIKSFLGSPKLATALKMWKFQDNTNESIWIQKGFFGICFLHFFYVSPWMRRVLVVRFHVSLVLLPFPFPYPFLFQNFWDVLRPSP